MHAIYENHSLSDRDVANFARQSFADLAENFTDEQNSNLIRFLARGVNSEDWSRLIDQILALETRQEAVEIVNHLRRIPQHWAPFGHPQISLRMAAPVPIRVQCFKHKIGYVESEESRRYISSTPKLYIPDHFRAVAANVKQGSGDAHPESDYWRALYIESCDRALYLYQRMIEAGVCPEQARFSLPQGCEVNWVWTGSLYAYANFYNQRSDSHAQKEIRDLAAQVDAIIRPLYPVSWSALAD